MKFEDRIIGMAAVDAAARNQTVEEVLASVIADMDVQATPRRATAPSQATRPAAPQPVRPVDRNAAIDGATLPGCEELAASLKADAGVSAENAALQISARYKQLQSLHHHIGGVIRRSDVPSANPLLPAGVPATDAEAVSAWQAAPKLQADFASAAIFANYATGVRTGRARIFGGSPGIIRRGG